MPKSRIKYRSGYKYQLAADYSVSTKIKPKEEIDTKFIKLDLEGNLTVKDGYAWDGPSGPVIDRKENMRASLVHDAFYQLMRRRKLTVKKYKDKADRLFRKMCIQDGIRKETARVYYLGLQIGGKPATDTKNKKKIKKSGYHSLNLINEKSQ